MWWIYEEQLARKENPNFDLSHQSLKDFFDELDKLYFELARFDIPHLKMLSEQCVSTIANYLVRPRTTLSWFIFRGEPTKTIKEITLRLDYFHHYSYIKDGFYQWLNSNNIDQSSDSLLSISEFKRIIEQADNQVIFNYTIEQFIELIEPIFEFYCDNYTYEPSIPVETLILFLDDKGIHPISERLANDSKKNNIHTINKPFLKQYILDLLLEFENSQQQNLNAENQTTTE
jgi:hypothetical protein